MIDPINISNFNLTDDQLEENILFWVTAAGKNGVTAVKLLNNFFKNITDRLHLIGHHHIDLDYSPFRLIRLFDNESRSCPGLLQKVMKDAGIGNHTMKSRAFLELAYSYLDLRTCTVDDLSKIHGIGPKTARAFLVHTRPNQRYAVVDTHLLKFLRHQGIMAPKSTPPEGPQYQRLEKAFLDICDKYSLKAADLDLAIWNHYRKTAFQFDLEAYTNDYHQSSICGSCDGGR